MTNVFIINGGHAFEFSEGVFNKTLTEMTASFFQSLEGHQVQTTEVGNNYRPEEEVEKYKWADLIVYHTPVWWFQVPFGFKRYIDEVFTAGYQNGIYHSDGRNEENPKINYGTGGLLQGKSYLLTTSWNAPHQAFTQKEEFFSQTSVDDGPLFGFHRMNAFVGLALAGTYHFYDVMKHADIPAELDGYKQFLTQKFEVAATC